MRIALTVDPEIEVPPIHYGGIERIADMLARNLQQRGHEVTLFANPDSACPVEVVGWPGRSSVAYTDTIRNASTLASHLGRKGFDIVHSFSRLAYLAPFLPLRIAKLMSYGREISPRTTGMAFHLSGGTLEFTAVSKSMLERNKLPGIWHLVPNCVPIETYTFRQHVFSDAPLIFLGRIEEIKGPHLAIEVARASGRPLIIAGNVPQEHRSWFEAHVAPHLRSDDIRYAGPVDDQQKNELLGQASALLMPILWEEPFGMVMAEAMACGTPVIGLRRGAVPEVVDDGLTGFVCESADEMAAAVSRLGEIDRAACRTRVEKFYSDASVTERYLEIYGQMLARRMRDSSLKMAG
ncbi:MAG: glycosyltransferase family 4 protein [Rhodomicrobium sp.]